MGVIYIVWAILEFAGVSITTNRFVIGFICFALGTSFIAGAADYK